MAIFLNLCSAASILGLLAIAGNDLGISPPVGVARETRGVVRMTGRPAPKASFAAPVVFNAYARSKVVQYFDTYRSEPIGLPSGSAPMVGTVGDAGWEGPEIISGTVIPESDRSFLLDVPVELVRVLAAQSQVVVRYYLAGNSLVAVDPGYKVMDLVRIPTAPAGEQEKLGARGKEVQLVGYKYRR